MTLLLRAAAIATAVALVWIAGASRVQSSERLPLGAIVPTATVTLPFGCTTLTLEPFDPTCRGHHVHTGVDLGAPVGTPVNAAVAGVVRVGFERDRCGLFVVEVVGDHVRVLYCHLSAVKVVEGQQVAAGDEIGAVGTTGLTTGSHLHFEVDVDGRAVDPVAWLSDSTHP